MKLSQILVSLYLVASLGTTACSKFNADNKDQSPVSDGTGSGSGDNTDNTNTGGDTKNPPDSSTGGDTDPLPDDTCKQVSGSYNLKSVVLNQSESFTKSLNATIHTDQDILEIGKMKISEGEDCKCGNWEVFSAQKAWTLKKPNGLNSLSVQFKDFEGRTSKCTNLSVTHDDLAPQVSAVLDAGNKYQEPANTTISVSSSDTGSGIKSVVCRLNGSSINCSAGISQVYLQAQKTGAYKFEITATDNLGFSASTNVAWNVATPYKQITQNYEVKSNNKVDILLIDDNSGSMEYEQKSMAKRMSSFLGVLSGLDWRIGITTTDPNDYVEWGDGQLIKTEGPIKEYFIHSGMDANKARVALEQTIQRKETGSSDEQGIKVTYRSIERSLDSKDPNSTFYRNDAHFAAVVISDEDESKTDFKNIPANLLNYVSKLWPQKNFAFHSIITRPGDAACLKDEGYSYGSVYDKMSKLTGNGMIGGAIIGSVCAQDYGSQLAGIGNSVQAMQKIIDLDCAPVGDVNSSVLVDLDGSNYTDTYEVQGLRMVFKNPLPAGKYRLEYKCVN